LTHDDSSARNYELRDPDVRLMLQVRADNAAAFEELVLRYQVRVITVLERLVHRRDVAEDLAQDVFLRVFRARKNYEPTAKFSTWLFTIANHVASNALRSRARRREVSGAPRSSADSQPMLLEQIAVADSGLMPARQLSNRERIEMVREAIQGLSDGQRSALVLSKFEGMSYTDIGQVMNLTPQAVKSLLSRARRNLRLALEPYIQ
jgi:RNA polymerase sigma-70 factor (ECF subfamily)